MTRPGKGGQAPRPDREASREVQLDARHLALSVVVVVALCVVSFLLGRWVERRSLGVAVAAEGAPAGRGEPLVEEMGDVSEDLTFFDTLGGDREVPLETAAAPRESPPLAPAPRGAGASRPESTAAATPRRSVAEGIMVQVLASRDRAAADALRRRLRSRGYTALLVREKGVYKVRVGPYADREEAKRAAILLRDREKLTTWIP